MNRQTFTDLVCKQLCEDSPRAFVDNLITVIDVTGVVDSCSVDDDVPGDEDDNLTYAMEEINNLIAIRSDRKVKIDTPEFVTLKLWIEFTDAGLDVDGYLKVVDVLAARLSHFIPEVVCTQTFHDFSVEIEAEIPEISKVIAQVKELSAMGVAIDENETVHHSSTLTGTSSSYGYQQGNFQPPQWAIDKLKHK